MANSFQLFVRAAIMLSCMVVIPLIALFNKQIPEFCSAIWNGQDRAATWQARPTGGPAPAAQPSTTSERFASQQSRSDLQEAPKFGAPDAPPTKSNTLPGGFAPPTAGAKPEPAAPRVLPELARAEPLSVGPANRGLPTGMTPPPSLAQQPPGAAPRTPIHDPFVRPSAADTADAAAVDPLAAAQQRLRALGVGYFKLETTGEATIRYRCYCQVKAGDGPVQDFQATHAVPLAAVQDVTDQIERWQATLKDRVGQGPTKLR
ncbi:MAG: hypothetical protein QM811_25760 [Pirellulales bacterium]